MSTPSNETCCFVKGTVRPQPDDGIETLNLPVLTTRFTSSSFFKLNGSGYPDNTDSVARTKMTEPARIRHLWNIPSPIDNLHNFDEVLKQSSENLVFIYAPQKDSIASLKTRAQVSSDYTALQVVLASLGVKQSHSLTKEVKFMFVHVSEKEEIGKIGSYGGLAELEKLREKGVDEVFFFLFGMEKDSSGQKEVRALRKFWDTSKSSGAR